MTSSALHRKVHQTHHPDWKQWLAKADLPPKDPTPVEAMQWQLSTPEGRDFLRKTQIKGLINIW